MRDSCKSIERFIFRFGVARRKKELETIQYVHIQCVKWVLIETFPFRKFCSCFFFRAAFSWYSLPFNKLCPRRNIVLISTKSLATSLTHSHKSPFIFRLLFCGDCTCVKLAFVFRCLDDSRWTPETRNTYSESYKHAEHRIATKYQFQQTRHEKHLF